MTSYYGIMRDTTMQTTNWLLVGVIVVLCVIAVLLAILIAVTV